MPSNPYRLRQDFSGPFRFTLRPSVSVNLTVVDQAHHPVQGVNVHPWFFQRPQKGDMANLFLDSHFARLTDASRRVRFDFVPPDNEGKINFWTRLKGYVEKDRCLFDPKSGSRDLEQTILRLLHVSGRVLDPDGRPAPSVPVRAGGDGYEMDDFGGEVTTGADGNFAIDIAPQKFYIFVAASGKLAAPPYRMIVHHKAPAKPIEIRLEPGVRIHGTATMGPDRKPVANTSISLVQQDYDGYRNLRESERLPGGRVGRKSIIPSVFLNSKSDENGRYEFYASPGRFYVDGFFGGTRVIEHFVADDSHKFEVNLHTNSTGEQYINGRVVRANNPSVAVAEATITGAAMGMEQLSHIGEGVSDRQGNFSVRQGKFDLYLCAVTPDGLRGIVLVKNSQHEAAIRVGPTASARARLVDPDGRPISNRPVRYGVNAAESADGHGPFTWAFGDTVTTDEQGFFTATGLVPGFEYELSATASFNADGQPYASRTVAKPKPARPGQLDLRDVMLPAEPKAKTSQDYAAEAFRPTKSFEERLASARHVASVSFQRVLVMLARPTDPEAKAFFGYRYYHENPEAWQALGNFVLVCVDTGGAHAAAAEKWARQAGVNWDPATVTFTVVDVDGRLVTQRGATALSVNGGLDRQKLIDFVERHAPPLPDAQQVLDQALARAATEKKNVMLDESAPYCGWCVKLADYF